MNNIRIIKFNINESDSSIPREYFEFDLDNGKNFCYRSRISFNAFFNSGKRRNHDGEWIYYRDELMNSDRYLSESYSQIYGIPTWKSCKNIWEFYKLIGYDYKKKKFSVESKAAEA